MPKPFIRLAPALALMFAVSGVSSAAAGPGASEAALSALDARQKAMVARADVEGLDALAAAQLTINAPTGRVLTKDQFIGMMRDGRIGAEAFERQVESVTVGGDVGVVMGREVFTPTKDSELGRMYGVRPLNRRYTNVYQLERGRWRWVARHANVVPEASAPPM